MGRSPLLSFQIEEAAYPGGARSPLQGVGNACATARRERAPDRSPGHISQRPLKRHLHMKVHRSPRDTAQAHAQGSYSAHM